VGDLDRLEDKIAQIDFEEDPMTGHTDPMTDQIEREELIPAPPDEVWEAITSSGFLADEVQLELYPGGEASFDDRTGWVEEAVEPAADPDGAGRLVFWWSTYGEPASRVELTLEPEDHVCTRLRVVESRPLEVLDVTGIPLPGSGGSSYGPAMVAVA
jgi:hypothetical protein